MVNRLGFRVEGCVLRCSNLTVSNRQLHARPHSKHPENPTSNSKTPSMPTRCGCIHLKLNGRSRTRCTGYNAWWHRPKSAVQFPEKWNTLS